MTATSGRPHTADAGADACPLDLNDELLEKPIDEEWIDIVDDRICREFVRQLQQQENTFVTTNRETRLANVRALESLMRQLNFMARRVNARDARRAIKHTSNPHDAFLALERRLLPLLEHAIDERNSKDLDR